MEKQNSKNVVHDADSMGLAALCSPEIMDFINVDLFKSQVSKDIFATLSVEKKSAQPVSPEDLDFLYLQKTGDTISPNIVSFVKKNPWYVVEALKRRSEKFKVVSKIHGLAADVESSDAPVDLLISKSLQALGGLATKSGSTTMSMQELDSLASSCKQKKLDTHSGLITDLFGGLYTARHYVVAGYTGNGKSYFAMKLACLVSANNQVAYFSLEMGASEISARFKKLGANEKNLRVGVGALNLNSLLLEINTLKNNYDVSLIVVDYVGLLSHALSSQSEIVIEYVKSISSACRRLNIALITVAQLRKPPSIKSTMQSGTIHDIKDASELVHDADAVVICKKEGASIVVSTEKNRFLPSSPCATLLFKGLMNE